MTPAVEMIIAQIDALTPAEQSELAYEFLCSFEPAPEVAAKWEAEVNRRWNDARRLKQAGIPAQQVFENLRNRSRP